MPVGRNGDTLESVRDLIAVPPQTQVMLQAFAEEFPEYKPGIEAIFSYRQKILAEFERLAGGTVRGWHGSRRAAISHLLE